MKRNWLRKLPDLFIGLFILILTATCGVNSSGEANALFDFEKDSDLDRFAWRCPSMFSISDEWAKNGKHSLKFEFYPAKQIGFSSGKITHYWKNATTLNFTVYNPDTKDIELFIQISDGMTKGYPAKAFVAKLNVVPGKNDIKLDVTSFKDSSHRLLNLEDIKGFYFYKVGVTVRTVLFFDCFYLE